MQNMTQLSPEYLSHLSKLDQLLRFYQISKKSDKFSQVSDRTKIKINSIILSLKTFNSFRGIEEDIMAKIDKVFEPMKTRSSAKASKNSSVRPSEKSMQPNQSFSSNSNSNTGQSQRPHQTYKQSSPIKKMTSVRIQKSSEASVQTPKMEHQSIKSMKFQNKKVDKPVQVKKQIQKQAKPVKPLTSADKLIDLPVSVEAKDSVNGMMSIISSETSGQPIESLDSGHVNQSSNNSANIVNLTSQLQSGTLSSDNKVQSISSINQITQNKVSNDSLGILESESVMSSSQSQRLDSKDDSKDKDDDNQSQASNKSSEISSNEQIIDIVVRFFTERRDRLNYGLVFNNQLFHQMEQQLDGHFYVFGVNKPESKKITQLYGCTLMKFLIAQLFNGNNKFEKEMKDFSNNIRIPIGLIFKGAGPDSITPQHIKFLQNIRSPFPIILVLKDDSGDTGILCSFHDAILERIRITPRKQLGECVGELRKRTYILPYGQEHFPSDKNKVMTKYLSRQIPDQAQQAHNAISIAMNDCIRQEKQCFIYKFHTKYLQSVKVDFAIYYVNNGVVNARMIFKDKDFSAFRKQVMESQTKLPMILSMAVNKQTVAIRKDFLQLVFESRSKRDIVFFITVSALTLKKTIIVSLKAEITEQQINSSQVMDFRAFEKDTHITNCIHVVTKTNNKEFESEGKVDLVEIKAK